VKKIKLFRRFDPRLAVELRKQRRSILIGLLCVAVGSALDGLTLPLLEGSITAIQQAAPSSLARAAQIEARKDRLKKQARDVAQVLGTPLELTEKAFLANAETIEARQNQDAAEVLSKPLRRSEREIERALSAGSNQSTGNIDAVRRLGLFSLLVVALYGLRYWFVRGQAYYLSRAAARLSSDMRERLFAKLQQLPVSYFGEKRVGGIQSVLTNDVNVYQNAVSIVRDSIDGPIKALIAFVYIFVTQWQLAAVTLMFLPAMAYVIDRNGKRMRQAQAQVQVDLGELGASTNESLQGMRVIKAFSAEDQIQTRYRGFVERSFQSQMVAARRFAALRPLVELIGACAMATVLYICGWLSYLGKLELGQIAALIYALDRINQGLRSLGNVSSTYNQVQAATDRLHKEVLDVPDQVEADGAVVLESPRGQIEFRNVTFRYPDGTEALKNVSFVLDPGTSLALVGPSGAGKSTIADLVLRFYDPTEGQVLFDGVDLRELKLSWLRKQIGVVPQHTFLFAGSVAENVRMGDPNATDAEIAEAAHMAHADEFVDRMERGYLSEIGEGGTRISGGQRQRLAIARALVRKPAVLLLDEATSALDATSEKAVTEALDEVMKQRTTLFIAHRLTTAARADRILVLSKGEVIESGSHAELMAANGAYAGLFRAFSGGILD
jgi:subfamily B ATP-binding cassette protein MsbA